MKLKDIFGSCSYTWYGAGGHQSLGRKFEPPLPPFAIQGYDLVNADGKWVSTIRALPKFKIHRVFVDNWSIVPEAQPPFTVKLNPTEQNFYFDEYFKLQKANGIKNIVSLSGCFDWYKPTLNGQSQRKHACYNPAMSPDDPKAWEDFANLCRLVALHFKDSGLADWLQLLNEWDFPFGINDPLTPEQYAVGLWEGIKAIRSVAPNQKIMAGCTLTPKLATFQRLISALDTLAAKEGQPKVRGITLSVNLYNRTSSTNQGSGIGATYEETDTHGKFLKPFNDWCEIEGFDWAMTEAGNSSTPSTSAAAMKNKAPQLEGYTTEESQGIMHIRIALICSSLSRCVAVTFYTAKDGFEQEPFLHHGWNYDKDFGGKPDWSAKPARTICEEFLEKYGEWEVEEFRHLSPNTGYAIKWKGKDSGLVWTDKKNFQSFTPFPTHIDLLVTQPPPMLDIQNKKVYKDGQPFFIKELNSPEPLLHLPLADFKAIVDYAVSVGLNTGYWTLYAGDKYSATLHPYNGTKSVGGKTFGNPSSGFNMPKILDWKAKLEYAASKGMVLHLLLSEKENHHVKTTAEEKAFMDVMVEHFDHLPVIWDREEVPLGMDGFIIASYTYLQSITQNICAIHNNTGEKPWTGHKNIIDLLSIQADISSFDSIIKAETASGFAAYASEMTGGFTANDTAKAERIRTAGGEHSSGAGIYIPSLDQDATLAQLKTYEPVFKALSGTTTPPNPTGMLRYSLSPNPFPNSLPLHGAQIPTGSKVYIYYDGTGKTPLIFMPSGQKESRAPYEYAGGQPVTLADGVRTVSITDGNGALLGNATFEVGVIVPPPTPVDVKGTTFVKKVNGKIEFSFEDNTKLIVTPD